MPAWFLFILFVGFVSCDGFLFNVSRGAQGNGRDTFSNMDPTGKCLRTNDNGKDWCLAKNAECGLQGCCICACKYDYSTFRMAPSVDSATCVRNRDLRNFSGCTQKFAEMSDSQPLVTLNLQEEGFKGVVGLPAASMCVVKSVLYLHQGMWSCLDSSLKNTFGIEKTGTSWLTQNLTWDKNLPSSYFGYIMKINAECSPGKRSKNHSFCVVFKSSGTISWNIPDPATKDPQVISVRPAATTDGPTTKATTEVKSTTKAVPTTAATNKTTSTEAPPQQLTTQQITGTNVASKTLPKTAKLTSSFTESTVRAMSHTEPLSIEITTAEPTYNTGSRDKLSGTEETEHDTLMIALIAGGAAVICMAVILLCIWLIVSRRRKNRLAVSYDAGTTVIANPTTGLQNHFPMPGLLKNPVFDDSVYAEPETNTKKSAVGQLDQPSYEIPQDLLAKNPGANDARSSPPLNNIRTTPLNTTSRKILREHTYDSTEQITRGKCEYEIPEYLALLNPNETSNNASPSSSEYQPPYSTGPPPENTEEHPEYADYADLDELEEIAAKEGSNKSLNEDPCYEVPVDNVPQAPTYDYALPGDVIPDRPDLDSCSFTNQGYELHLYAVLEGPDTAP